MKNICIAITLSALISACSTPARKSFDSTSDCNESGAYDRGYSEGKSGLNPDTSYSAGCRDDLQDAVRKGYRAGYDKGYPEYKEMVAAMRAQQSGGSPESSNIEMNPSSSPTVYSCQISQAGLQFQSEGPTLDDARTRVVNQCAVSFNIRICNALPRCGEESASQNPRAVYCSLSVFTHQYEAFGPTSLETKVALKRKCAAAEQSDFFCKESSMQCRANQ